MLDHNKPTAVQVTRRPLRQVSSAAIYDLMCMEKVTHKRLHNLDMRDIHEL